MNKEQYEYIIDKYTEIFAELLRIMKSIKECIEKPITKLNEQKELEDVVIPNYDIAIKGAKEEVEELNKKIALLETYDNEIGLLNTQEFHNTWKLLKDRIKKFEIFFEKHVQNAMPEVQEKNSKCDMVNKNYNEHYINMLIPMINESIQLIDDEVYKGIMHLLREEKNIK